MGQSPSPLLLQSPGIDGGRPGLGRLSGGRLGFPPGPQLVMQSQLVPGNMQHCDSLSQSLTQHSTSAVTLSSGSEPSTRGGAQFACVPWGPEGQTELTHPREEGPRSSSLQPAYPVIHSPHSFPLQVFPDHLVRARPYKSYCASEPRTTMSGRDRLNKENTTSHKIEGNGREGSEGSKLRLTSTNKLEEVPLRAEERAAANAWYAGGQRRGQNVGSRRAWQRGGQGDRSGDLTLKPIRRVFVHLF